MRDDFRREAFRIRCEGIRGKCTERATATRVRRLPRGFYGRPRVLGEGNELRMRVLLLVKKSTEHLSVLFLEHGEGMAEVLESLNAD
jgi:hypothetical protein